MTMIKNIKKIKLNDINSYFKKSRFLDCRYNGFCYYSDVFYNGQLKYNKAIIFNLDSINKEIKKTSNLIELGLMGSYVLEILPNFFNYEFISETVFIFTCDKKLNSDTRKGMRKIIHPMIVVKRGEFYYSAYEIVGDDSISLLGQFTSTDFTKLTLEVKQKLKL